MSDNNIDVRVENILVRFSVSPPIDLEEAVERLGGVKNGDVIIKALDAPRATLVIDAQGRIIVHGTHRIGAARAAAKEMLLRMGRDESGMTTELYLLSHLLNSGTLSLSTTYVLICKVERRVLMKDWVA